MNGPSEEARYLASWLVQHMYEWFPGENLKEEQLVKLIDEYFNSRQ